MTREEAKAEFAELMKRLPELLAYFEGVLENAGIDLSGTPEECLSLAGDWLVGNGRLEPRRLRDWFRPRDDDDIDLSVPTKSACCYFGLMFGDRLVKNVPRTAWVLVTENNQDIDYHRAVVRPAGNRTQIDPLRVAMNYVLGRLKGSRKGSFADLYRIWNDALTPDR